MLLFIMPLPTTLLEVAEKLETESLELTLPYVQIWRHSWNVDVICVWLFMVSSLFICKLLSVGQKKIL
jgi:hypothetical protein